VSCNSTPSTDTATETGLSEADSLSYLKKGKGIAASSFAVLSGALQKAMQEGGVSNAIDYCHLSAFPLIDSLSQIHQAEIKRTTLKVRNPKDRPNEVEAAVLKKYDQQAAKGEQLKPFVTLADGQRVAFYAPIMMNDLCLKCHGKIGETLAEEDYIHIQKRYPEDEAVGYVAGDFRGMWSIQFDR
jgi:hypothetical protein